jgi:methylated-DNA-[protein]-cysteine S-methyltransferase
MKLQGWSCPTPLGPFSVVAHNGVAVAAGFTENFDDLLLPPNSDGIEMVSEIAGVTDRVKAYFGGDISAIDDIPIRPSGSERKIGAWKALRKAPPGPMSYKGLSELMPPPASARSAARACATNPICLIVPCHRFIGSDGKMHGYYWGLEVKEWLLDHEERFTTRSDPA